VVATLAVLVVVDVALDACEDEDVVAVPAESTEVPEVPLLAQPASNINRRMPPSILHVQEERLVFSRCSNFVMSDLLYCFL
jgi:hypothetical protein